MEPLTQDEIWQLCDQQPGWAALTTLDEDGYPHTVAIGYFRLEQVLYCGCRAGTRKCRNLLANPKATLMIESGRASGSLRGVMFQGQGRVIEDAGELLAIKQKLAHKRGQQPPTEVASGIAYIELKPQRIRSWKR